MTKNETLDKFAAPMLAKIELAEAAQKTFAEAVEAGEHETILEAAGTLVALGAESLIWEHWPHLFDEGQPYDDTLESEIYGWLKAADFTYVYDAGGRIAMDAEQLSIIDSEDFDAFAVPTIDALRARDRAEFILLGARKLAWMWRPDAEQGSSIMAFRGLVEPLRDYLLVLGPSRAAEVNWVEAKYRKRFWWRTLGEHLEADALNKVMDAARVLVELPQSRAYLDRWVTTWGRWERESAAGSHADGLLAGIQNPVIAQ
jgi:hypothetical protein